MTECYFTPSKETTSATVCANCGKEKYLHTIGEGIKAEVYMIIYDNFQCCDDCDLPDACSDFGCAIKNGIRKRREW